MSRSILNYEMKNSIDRRICVIGGGAFQSQVGLIVELVLDVVLDVDHDLLNMSRRLRCKY